MIQLSPYAERVIDRISMIGMWLAVAICVRNFLVCLQQYRRNHGVIHLMNMGQVGILFIHRIIYGLVPLFEIVSCSFWPVLVSLWHLDYILIYLIMFKRLLILEAVEDSRWIKFVGLFLIIVRFADWPYELAFHTVQRTIMNQTLSAGSNCLAQWGTGVIILNFVADCLANLFLSGMFVRRLYIHIKMSRNLMSHRNRVIEDIAKKSLICLILTFFVNFAMNLLKTTYFIGDRSDAFTAYFEIIESTLLVEALRVDYTRLPDQSFCEHCGMVIHHMSNSNGNSNKRQMDEELNNINITSMSPNPHDQSTVSYNPNHSHASHSSPIYSNDQLVSSLRISTN